MTPDEIAREWYRQMEFAPAVPTDERGELWGEVEHTDAYAFAKRIAAAIAAERAAREKAEAERDEWRSKYTTRLQSYESIRVAALREAVAVANGYIDPFAKHIAREILALIDKEPATDG